MLTLLIFLTPNPKPAPISFQSAARSLLAGSLLLCLAALVACDSDRGAGSSSDDSASDDRTSPSLSARSAQDPAQSARQTGPDSNASLRDSTPDIDLDIDPDNVTLRARYTPRAQLLKELSTRYGFKVLGRAKSDARIDIDADSLPIEAVLAVLLEGEPYALQYAASPGLDRRVELVLLGNTDQHLITLRSRRMAERRKSRSQDTARERKRERSARQETLAALSKEERETFLEREAEEREAQRREQAERARTELYSRDAAERVRAIEHLGKDTVSDEELADIARSDPDASVRASAISRLGKSESPEAEASVLSALDDADPIVVIEAIESLEWKDRRSDIPKITPFLDHENAEVRAAAEGAVEFMGL